MAIPVADALPRPPVAVIDALVQGSYWSTGPDRQLTYAFYDTFADFWTPFGRDVGRTITAIVEEYINIDFFETFPSANPANAFSDLSIFLSGDVLGSALNEPGLLGVAFFPDPPYLDAVLPQVGISSLEYPTAEGDIFLESYQLAFQFAYPGGEGFAVGLHELLHALGLKHPHDDGSSGRPTFQQIGAESLDYQEYTVMSYNRISNDISFGHPATPMVLDVVALQYIYGPNNNTRSGNDFYDFSGFNATQTVWDAGGFDTISAAGAPNGVFIDMNPGMYSTNNGGLTRQYVAFGVDVERADGSAFADVILGSEIANEIAGGGGDDIILGNGANDTLWAGGGDDDVNGNLGVDLVHGEGGRDFVRGGQDSDTVWGDDGDDWHVNGNRGSDLVFGGTGNDNMFGGPDSDLLWGGPGDDRLSGDLGDDTLHGEEGSDVFLVFANGGQDLVNDFDPGAGDVIAIA